MTGVSVDLRSHGEAAVRVGGGSGSGYLLLELAARRVPRAAPALLTSRRGGTVSASQSRTPARGCSPCAPVSVSN